MADIVNERDKTLQTAERRTVEVEDPSAVVIPGYTGIVLSQVPSLFVIAPNTYPYLVRAWHTTGASELNDRMILTAQLRGIPPGTAVVWETGKIEYYTGPNPAQGGMITTLSRFVPGPTTIILTDTPDPLVKLIEASSYPRTSPTQNAYNFIPTGIVRVSVQYAGQTFTDQRSVSTFTG